MIERLRVARRACPARSFSGPRRSSARSSQEIEWKLIGAFQTRSDRDLPTLRRVCAFTFTLAPSRDLHSPLSLAAFARFFDPYRTRKGVILVALIVHVVKIKNRAPRRSKPGERAVRSIDLRANFSVGYVISRVVHHAVEQRHLTAPKCTSELVRVEKNKKGKEAGRDLRMLASFISEPRPFRPSKSHPGMFSPRRFCACRRDS